MEQPSKKEERMLSDWIKEAGLEHPSPSFKNDVMDAIALKAQETKLYQPLISKRGWVVISMLIIGMMGAMFFVPVEETSWFEGLRMFSFKSFQNPLANLSISNTTLYAACLLGLFWVQIPLLKHWMQKP